MTAYPDMTASLEVTGPASTRYRCRTAAIRFPLRHPAVVSVVSGMRSGGQVAPALGRFATVVPDEAWTELDAC
jgi:aryl-alcohol dehydrogenase-like predicted oxidoreductase